MSSVPEVDTTVDDVPPAPETAPPRRSPLSPLVIGLGVLALAAIVFGIVQFSRASDLRDQRDVRNEAARRAGEFAEALLTYDYNDLGAARERVLALATDEYADVYDQAFTQGPEPQIRQLQATSTARVRDVYVADASSERAKVIVIVDAEALSSAGTRNLVGTYLALDLVRQDGEFKINSVTAVAAENETQTPPASTPSDSSSTTVAG